MIVAWRNRLEAATATASAHAGAMAVQNALVDPVALPWIVAGTGAWADFDCGAPTLFRVFAALGLENVSGWRIRLGSGQGLSDVYDSGDLLTGATAALPEAWHLLPEPVSARWARIEVSGLSEMRIGRLFGGPALEPERSWQYGEGPHVEDPSLKDRSLGGQLLVARRPKWRVLSFTLPLGTYAELLGEGLDLDLEAGLTSNVVVMLDPAGQPHRLSIYGTVLRATPHVVTSHGRIAKSWQIEQRL